VVVAETPGVPTILIHADDRLLAEIASPLRARYRVVTESESAAADLIVCDGRLSDVGGAPLWRALRAAPALRDAPLLLILDADANDVPVAEIDDAIYRPVQPGPLVTQIELNLKRVRERREAAARETALKTEAEAVLRRVEIVLRHLPFGLTMVNPEGQILYANPARERLLRFDGQPKIGQHLAERLPARHADGRELSPEEYPIRRALRGELVTDLEIEYDNGNGTKRWLRTSGIPVPRPDGTIQYAIGVTIDVTGEQAARQELVKLTESLEERVHSEIDERLKAEAALRQVQKMQAIGQLTGGVAHDFNNLLQVMLGNLDAVERQLAGEAPLDRARLLRQAGAALRGAERATQMTRQLLAFSRRQALNPTPIDVNKLVLGMTELLRRTLGERIRVETTIDPSLDLAFADPNQLESALLNFAVNARDAMPEGGRLTIETTHCIFDADSKPWDEYVPRAYVMIAVTDTGVGIPPEVMPRIFEPFFTTKEVGRGTGLGLAQAYGFAKQSGGHIKLHSEVGIGTTVKLYLPAHEGAEPKDRRDTPPPALRGLQGETILVVEDDPDVRAFSAETLRELGYRVIEANSGPEALRLLDKEPRIRVLFTDVGLPEGMSGRQLADDARKRRPDLNVLFTTGYARDSIVHEGRLDPGIELIAKPFTANALAARIRSLIEKE